MSCLKFFVLAAFVLCYIDLSYECSGGSGSGGSSGGSSEDSGGGSSTRAHDIDTKEGLRELYNKPVVKAERVERPMSGTLGTLGVKHSGVRVTLEDGSQQLVHKGKGFGESGQTVVTDANHMSSDWQVTSEKKVQGARVGDYVATGGEKYNVATDNCHDGSERMMELPNGDQDDQDDN